MSSYWDINEKEEFDSAQSGQITMRTTSGKYIYGILREEAGHTVNRIVEIGTWNGLGSTMCIVLGIQGKSIELFQSIECNKDKHLCAVEHFKGHLSDSAELIWGSIVNPEHINSEEYRKYFPGLETSDLLRGWFDIDLKNCMAAPNVLHSLPEEIDFLLLDGGEYTTLNEFEILLPRCVMYIALDDTTQDKCRECRARLISSQEWTEIVHLDERNGFSISKHV